MASFADYVKDLMEAVPKVNGNPMLSVTSMTDDNARYREDPFYRSRDIQARDQLVLDEEERRRREAALSGSGPGMMTGGNNDGALTPEQIAFLDAEAAIPGARAGRMGKINSMLSLVAHGIVPGLPTLSIAQMGPTAYADMMQGHARTVSEDPYGYTGSNPVVPGRQPGLPAPVVTADDLAAIQNSVYSAPAYQAGSDGDSLSDTPDAFTGADVSYGDTSYGTLF